MVGDRRGSVDGEERELSAGMMPGSRLAARGRGEELLAVFEGKLWTCLYLDVRVLLPLKAGDRDGALLASPGAGTSLVERARHGEITRGGGRGTYRGGGIVHHSSSSSFVRPSIINFFIVDKGCWISTGHRTRGGS